MSVIPLNFRPVPAGGILASVYGLGRPLPSNLSRADILANGLVFAAFGLFGTGALAFGRRGVLARGGAVAAVLAGGLFLGCGLEFAQVFLPGRDSSVADVAAQSAGTIVGATAFLLGGERVVNWLRQVAARRERPSALLWLLSAYAAVFAAWRLFPFEFTVRPGALWRKVESGQVALVPFQGVAGSPEALGRLVELTLAAVPLGALGMLIGVRPGRRRPVILALMLAAAFLAVVEGLAAFTLSGSADTGSILAGAAGALAGAVVVGQVSNRQVQRPAIAPGARRLWAATVAWVLLVVASEWNPFRFRFTKEAIEDGLQRLTLVPFGFYARDAPPIAFLNITRKTLLAAPLGLFLALAVGRQWPSVPRPLRVAFTCVGVAGLLVVLEAGQIFLPDRIPDVTDVMLPAAAATLAAWLATRQR
jgi:VanZ family protein